MNAVAENLRAVARMIREGKMWCKGEWSVLREAARNPIGTADRVGCAEGLLCERLGLYDGLIDSAVFKHDPNGPNLLITGKILKLLWEDEEDITNDSYFIDELHATDEWQVLAKTIIESGVVNPEDFSREDVVTVWNDKEDTTEEDAATMFDKAALRAEEMA